MKVALVHDSLTQLGGAERVLSALHEIYPEATVFTLVYDKKLKENFEGWEIVSSPLQYIYNILPKFQMLLPLIPLAVKFFDFSSFDLVISSSSVFAKAIRVPKGVMHINYCHTPSRLIWLETDEYLRDELPVYLRPLAKIYLNFLKIWDYNAAQRVDYFIANSENVKRRIKEFYKRDSVVIYPFCDTETFYPSLPKAEGESEYYLLAGRLQAHKKAEIAIQAFMKTHKRLHVVGSGRDVERLKEMAKHHPNIRFLGRVPDHVLCEEYSSAKAYIYPQEEDFGMMPLEANACGTPVIAFGKGGALEIIVENKTGVLFEKQTVESLIAAVDSFEQKTFQSEDLFEQAERFNKEKFKQKIEEFVTAAYFKRGN